MRNPAIRQMVVDAMAKRYPVEPAIGIIPFEHIEMDARDEMISQAAQMISNAVTGPAISAYDLAEKIVDVVIGLHTGYQE